MFYLKSKNEVAEDTLEIVVDLAGDSFDFLPGQYAEVGLVESKYKDNRGETRLFSMVSAPGTGELVFAWRKSDSAFKRSLTEAEPGLPLEIKGPFGFFTIEEELESEEKFIFIAGGIGVAPFMSMLRFLFGEEKKNFKKEIEMIYVNSKESRAAYRDELLVMATQNSNFIFREKIGALEEDDLIEVEEGGDKFFYVAGPPSMVAEALEILLNQGVDRGRIFMEDFLGY